MIACCDQQIDLLLEPIDCTCAQLQVSEACRCPRTRCVITIGVDCDDIVDIDRTITVDIVFGIRYAVDNCGDEGINVLTIDYAITVDIENAANRRSPNGICRAVLKPERCAPI